MLPLVPWDKIRSQGKINGFRCILGLVTIALGATGCRQDFPSTITLDRTCSVNLPSGTSVSGGVITENGLIALWSRSSSQAWFGSRDDSVATALVLRPGTDVVGARFVSDYALEYFDAFRRELVRLDARTPSLSTRSVDVALQVHAAVEFADGWLLGGLDVGGVASIAYVTDRSIWLKSVSPPQPPTANGDGFFLRKYGRDRALISLARSPFLSAVVNRRGDIKWLPPIADSLLNSLPRSKAGWNLWTGLPSLALRNGSVIQTLADLGSEERIVLTRDASGELQKYVRLGVPVGLIAASESGAHLLAFVRAPLGQAICYKVAA